MNNSKIEVPNLLALREGLKQRAAHGGKPDLQGRAQNNLKIGGKNKCGFTVI